MTNSGFLSFLEANISITFDRESLRVMSECALITESETTKKLVKQVEVQGRSSSLNDLSEDALS